MDVLGSLSIMTLLSPVFLFLFIYIKLTSNGEVIYKQMRVGYMGKEFTMFKFRSMKEAGRKEHETYVKDLIKNPNKVMKKKDKEMLLIPLGGLIRSLGLDELPQLFNVLRGEMSLVGPRPPLSYEVEEYLDWHSDRFDTVPGITGLWQVSGKNELSFNEMISLDIQYASGYNFLGDLSILVQTIWTVIHLAIKHMSDLKRK